MWRYVAMTLRRARREICILVGGRLYGGGMRLRYRYRLEPTSVQQRELTRVFGCCRVVFNDAVRVRDPAYRDGVRLSDTEVQRRVITQAKTTTERGWLAEVPSVALVQSANDASRAFRNFLDSRMKRRSGRKMGHPRMKSKKDNRQSFRLTRNGFRIRANGKLDIAKIGEVRVRWSRDLPSQPSSVTVIREPDGNYYASFVVEVEPAPLPTVRREVGVDVGIVRLATIADTDGVQTDLPNPKPMQRKLRKLRRLERKKARRQKGSNNRDKARRKVAVEHGKVSRARRDYHHKQALALVRDNQVIHVEDLYIVGMVRNHRLARSINDAAWGQFMQIIGQKCDRYGRTLHRVSRWPASSKICSNCGHQFDELTLTIRTWTCLTCGAVHDRDHNAAKNILAAGRAERRNACGVPVSPPTAEVRGDEAGSNPGAA
jgi:putative transposase